MCSVPRPRWLWVATGTASRIALDLVVGEAVGRAAARASAPATSSCAHGQAVMPWACDADQPARAALGGDGGAEQRVDLLRRDARHRRRLVLGVAGGDRDLGAPARPGARARARRCAAASVSAWKRLAEDDLADRLVDDLLEARHVRALLLRAEVDEALELGVEELLGAVRPDPDDLLDAGHADAREADLRRRAPGLDVGRGWRWIGRAAGHRLPCRVERRALLGIGRTLVLSTRRPGFGCLYFGAAGRVGAGSRDMGSRVAPEASALEGCVVERSWGREYQDRRTAR